MEPSTEDDSARGHFIASFTPDLGADLANRQFGVEFGNSAGGGGETVGGVTTLGGVAGSTCSRGAGAGIGSRGVVGAGTEGSVRSGAGFGCTRRCGSSGAGRAGDKRAGSACGDGTGVVLGSVLGGVEPGTGFSLAGEGLVSPSVRVDSAALACSAAATTGWCSRSLCRTE